MRALVNLVFALLACTMVSSESNQTQKFVLDMALVINTRPYVKGETNQWDWWKSAELKEISQEKDGLDEFIKALVDQAEISEAHLRVAVVNAFLSHKTYGPIHPTLEVKCNLQEGTHKTVVAECVRNIGEIDLKDNIKMPNPVWYEPKDLSADVAKMVFSAAADRSYVPKIIVLLAIGRGEMVNEQRSSFLKNFTGIHYRLIATSFESTADVIFSGPTDESLDVINLQEAARHLVGDLKKVTDGCNVETNPSVCYYPTLKREACRSEMIYKLVKDSKPSGFCQSGIGPPTDCNSEVDCDRGCDQSLQWTACFCNNGSKTRFRNTTDLPEKYHMACRYFEPTQKCTDEDKCLTKSLAPWAIAVICAVVGLLFLAGIGVGFFFLMRTVKRRRAQHCQTSGNCPKIFITFQYNPQYYEPPQINYFGHKNRNVSPYWMVGLPSKLETMLQSLNDTESGKQDSSIIEWQGQPNDNLPEEYGLAQVTRVAGLQLSDIEEKHLEPLRLELIYKDGDRHAFAMPQNPEFLDAVLFILNKLQQ